MGQADSHVLRFDAALRVEVTAACWSRFYLRIDADVRGSQGTVDFFLVTDECVGKIGLAFKVVDCAGSSFTIEANPANNGWRECLRAGTYRIVALDEQMRWNYAVLTAAAADDLAKMARAFPFGTRNRAQVVYFDAARGQNPAVLVKVEFARLDRAGFRDLASWEDGYRELSVVSGVRSAVATAGKRALSACCGAVRRLCKHSSARRSVLFLSERSNGLRPNMKAVRDRLAERGLDRELDIAVACHAPGSGAAKVASLFDVLSGVTRADCIVVDDYVPTLTWLDVPEDVVVIELWHAGAGFKAAGYARWGLPGAPAPVSAHRKNTFGISGSAKIAPFFSEVFGIEDESVIPLGMPRIDGFLDEARLRCCREAFLSEHPECAGKQVVLFAPTYRGSGRRSASYPYEMIDFGALYRMCGTDRVVVFKMHPWVSEPVPIPADCRDRLFDAGSTADINELFPVADVLVTDYSSSVFEFALMRKPMVFFAFDEGEFAHERGFHRPYGKSAPGKVCRTFEEVIAAIESEDFEFEKVGRFVEDHFDFIDDGACDRVIDWLILGGLPDEYASAIDARRARLREWRSLAFDRQLALLR